MRKAQSSIELVVILAVSLAFLAVMFNYASDQLSKLNAGQGIQNAENSVKGLADAANDVYSQGVGAKKRVFITIPDGVDAGKTGVQGNIVRISVQGTDVVEAADVNLSGSFPITAGGHFVVVKAKEGYVEIGAETISFSRNSIFVSLTPSDSGDENIVFSNNSGLDANIFLAANWSNPDVSLSFAPQNFSLSPSAQQTVTVTFTSTAASAGNYAGNLNIGAHFPSGDENFSLPLNAEVIAGGVSASLIVIPSTWTTTVGAGSSDSNSFSVCNNSASEMASVSFVPSTGDAGNWVNTLITPIEPLAADSCQSKTISLTVPAGTAPTTSTGTITVSDGTNSDLISLTVTVLDFTVPVVLLEAPAPGYTDVDGLIQFDFNVSDAETSISSCSLIINGSVDQTDNSITEGITQSFIKSGLANGSYTWDVNCTSSVSLVGTSGENRPFTVSSGVPQTVLLWARSASGGSNPSNVIGAANNTTSRTGGGNIYGFNYDASTISGTINQVELIWSHSIPATLSNDNVQIRYGISALNITKNTYNSSNTPVDRQGITEPEWEIIDVTSDRSWTAADISNLRVGGTYTRVGTRDNFWYLDAAGVRVTFTP